MANNVMTFTPDEIKDKLKLTPSAMDTLRRLSAHAGIEMDDDASREFVEFRNVRINDVMELWEFKAWCEKVSEFIKVTMKHSFNVGYEEQLPKNVSWGKQTFTCKFTNPLDAVRELAKIEGTPMENFAQWVTPKQAAEAAGITEERLLADVGHLIVTEPKERTLKIK